MLKTSRNLGIVGIIFGILLPFLGMVLGIIGLSINKEDGYKNRDIILNITAIAVSILCWGIWGYIWLMNY